MYIFHEESSRKQDVRTNNFGGFNKCAILDRPNPAKRD